MPARIESSLTVTDLPIIFWDNLVSTANVQAESDADYPATNVANPSTALKWRHDGDTGSPASAIEYFLIDITRSGTDTINYVAIAGHNGNATGTAIGLEAQEWNSPIAGALSLFEPQIPGDDSPLIFMFSPRELEGLRLVWVPTAEPLEMAVIYVGTYTVMDEGIQADHSPLAIANSYEVQSGRSENGQFLGRIVTSHMYSSTANFANIDEAWVRSDLVPFLNFAAENPFFYMWSPLSYPDDTNFAWLENDPQPVRDIDGYWSVDLAMRGQGA